MNLINSQLVPYIVVARIDHWFKNVFVIPGIIVALSADRILLNSSLALNVILALLAIGLVASSYYVLNELLDAQHDAQHPVKRTRPIPSGRVNVNLAYIEVAVLAFAGFLVALLVNTRVFGIVVALWLMACLYNIPPVRTKDKPYLDVLTEAVNNPLRPLVGWYCTGIQVVPPISLVITYWMIGAFFMAVKRFAEFRHIDDPQHAASYRHSFSHYNEERLLVSITYYSVAFGLFFGIFLLRYRIELILSVPFIAGFIAWYIHLGFLIDSPTQYPERLFRQTGFMVYTLVCVMVMIGLLFWNIPLIGSIFVPTIPTRYP
jgi:decaprenyl-phosphate phosphoribosyltransferase